MGFEPATTTESHLISSHLTSPHLTSLIHVGTPRLVGSNDVKMNKTKIRNEKKKTKEKIKLKREDTILRSHDWRSGWCCCRCYGEVVGRHSSLLFWLVAHLKYETYVRIKSINQCPPLVLSPSPLLLSSLDILLGFWRRRYTDIFSYLFPTPDVIL